MTFGCGVFYCCYCCCLDDGICFCRTEYGNHQWAILRKLAFCSSHVSVDQDLKWHNTTEWTRDIQSYNPVEIEVPWDFNMKILIFLCHFVASSVFQLTKICGSSMMISWKKRQLFNLKLTKNNHSMRQGMKWH